ncbi:MAG: DUF3105 domain-containing protein, partial [Chloroflexi bacterium]|nr:DUF3105 domain-containing protein [Chloroflexota bacterium]
MSRTSEKRAHRAAQRKSQQPNDLWSGNRRTALIGGGVVVLILAAFWLTNTLNTPQPAVTPVAAGTASATTAAPVGIGTVVSVPSLGGTHVNPGERHAAYNSTPPTSGPHYGTPANWGKYEQGLAEETWIHNLEHGGIVALYNCPQGCPELVSKLEGLLKTGPPSSFG